MAELKEGLIGGGLNLYFIYKFLRILTTPWEKSEAFNKFRGTSWMPEPCRSCDRKEIDWGGCRCQAFALTGIPEATDPTCELSPYRKVLDEPLSKIADKVPEFIYRRIE